MNTFSDRLLHFIDNQLHISVREFEKNLNLPQGTIQRAINGTNMGIDKLTLIADYYPELNMDWLIGGEGPMFEPEKVENNLMSEPPQDYSSPVGKAIIIIAESNQILSKNNTTLVENNTKLQEQNFKITERLLRLLDNFKEMA